MERLIITPDGTTLGGFLFNFKLNLIWRKLKPKL